MGRRTRRRLKRLIRLGILILVVGGIGNFIYDQFFAQKPDVKSATISPTTENKLPENSDTSLEKIVSDALAETKGNYSVVIKNLKTNKTFNLNEHELYQTGSLYKLWIMATTFKQIKEGSLKEDETLKANIVDLNNEFHISSDTAELTEGTISFSVESALNQMITISHNYAALLLTKKIRLSSVITFLEENKFQESEVNRSDEPPKTTASDMALFLERLYKGELADPEYTQKMIDLLKAQKLNEKLPKYLPEEVTIAHKTGELGQFSHDAGIVYTPKGDYIIVVLSESDSPAGANERIGQLSKVVYEYFVQ